jgi:tetratricopeptide (TPR) repeat protein/tRNA A-37 threonylcarbamoyl transferase component Bud32
MMKLDCRRCGSPIPLPAEAAFQATTIVACPKCGARYSRRAGSATASTLAPGPPGVPGPSIAPSAATAPTPATAPRDPSPAPSSPATQILGPAAPATLFRPEEVISGRYRIRRFIARGGMGEVYEAEDLELRQMVALKTVHPRDATHEVAIERFKREIYLARKVTHANVCRIYDVGYHAQPDGTSVIFLTMELLEGETLSHRIRRQGVLHPAEGLPIARQMMSALAAAHAAGVIHRDFKSENVFLVPSPEGTRVVVTDFGVARGVEVDQFAAQVTVADAAVGTPAYMAPEQIEGGVLTAAIDQYALGVVLFEMVTGDLPFAGDTPLATAVKRLTQAPPSPEELVPGLDPVWVAVIRRCMARYPADRFASVLDVDRTLAGESPAPAPGPATVLPAISGPVIVARARDPKRRTQIRLLIAVSVLLALALAQAVVRVRRSLESPLGESGEPRRAVAVVPFRNLAQREEFEWLSVALAEMVGSELRAGEGLRTVASDDVARARVDLGLAETDQPSGEVISTLRSRLGTDFVVLGSYTVLGSGDAASVRLAVRIEDAWKRETLGEAVETGGEKDLFQLVSRVGVQLRELLGSAARDSKSTTIASAPTNPRAAKLYSEGLLKLRAFEAPAARGLLEQAAAAEPAHPMIHAALAQAWSTLGFEQRAEQEAAKALEQGTGLPPEERLGVEGLAAELHHDWPRAQEIYTRLWTAFPDNLEYGLRLTRSQIDGGRADAAFLTIEALRALPEPDRANPRIDLAEAAAALATSDFSRQRDAAARAGARAEALNAPLLVAEARLREAEALRRLGDAAGAATASEASRQLYVAAGDRVGEAGAMTVAAAALFDRGDLAASRLATDRALSRYREAGDRGGVARSLNSLAVVARNLGELGQARTLYEEALQVLAEVGDRRGTAYTRNNLAAASAEEGRLQAARGEVTDALTVFRQLNDPSGIADALLNLGTIEHQQGELAAARQHLEEALAKKRDLGQKTGEAAAMVALGSLAIDRGALAEAESSLEAATASARETASRAVLSNALAAQAEIALESDDFARARMWAQESTVLRRELGRRGKVDESRMLLARIGLESGEVRSVLPDLEALASEGSPGRAPDLAAAIELARARAFAGLGRIGEAREALARGAALSSASEGLEIKLLTTAAALATEIAGAKPLAGLALEPGEAITVAAGKGFVLHALELELLRLRLGGRGGPGDGGGEAEAGLRRIASAATECGALRVARLAEAAAGAL